MLKDNDEVIRILKQSLLIVDELADFDDDDDEFPEIQELIIKAKKLKKNRLWVLK